MAVRETHALESDALAAHRLERWIRIARIVHPFPTLLNVAATAGLAFVAADGAPDGPTLALMLIAMLLAQCAIGVTNDIFDRELDAATKPWKPVASGLVSMRLAAGLALAFAVSALIVAMTLGSMSAALFVLGTGCGLAYDVRLKRTLLSALPFMVAIPVLPIWVYVTLGEWDDVLWWLLPLGGLIGLAMHLANTLPDIEADAAHGVRGLAHRVGVRGSLLVCWAAFASALALAAVIAPAVVEHWAWFAVAFGTGSLSLFVAVGGWVVMRERALQFNFGAISIGAAVTAAGWLAAVT